MTVRLPSRSLRRRRGSAPEEAARLGASAEAVHPLDEPEAGGRAIRGAALRAGSFLLGASLTLVSAPLVIHHLGIAEFGRYASVVALLAIAAAVTEGGLGPIGVREYAVLEGDERDRFMRNLFGIRLVFTVVGAVAAVLFAMLAGYTEAQVLGCALGAIGLLITVTQVTFAVPAYAELRLGRQVVAELAGQALLFVLVIAVILLDGGIAALLAATLPAAMLVLVLGLAFVPGVRPLRPAFELARWGAVLRDSLPVGLNTAVHAVYFRSVIIIMSLTVTSLETGLFATAYRIQEVLIGVIVMLVATTFPVVARAAHTDTARLGYATQRLFDTGVVCGLWFAGATAIGAPFAIDVVAPAEGAGATVVLQLLSISLLLAFLSTTFGTVVLSLRRHGALVLCSALALVTTLIAAAVLVPAYASIGGALAAVAGELVLVIGLAVAVRSADPVLRPALGVLPRAVLPAVIAAAVALWVPGSVPVAVGLFTVAYWWLVVLAGAFPHEIRDALLAGRMPRIPRRAGRRAGGPQ